MLDALDDGDAAAAAADGDALLGDARHGDDGGALGRCDNDPVAVAHANDPHHGSCHDDGRDDTPPRSDGVDGGHGFSKKKYNHYQ